MASWAPPVDRTTERWQRVRAACGHAADGIDLDRHADNVVALVESRHMTVAGRPSLTGVSAAGARRLKHGTHA